MPVSRHGRSRWPSLIIITLALAPAGCGSDGALSDGPRPADGGREGSAADGPLDPPVAFTLATWNVKDLFDATDDPSTSDDVPSASQVAQKLSQLGQAIRTLNADVLALQEVENAGLLVRLNTEQLASMKYEAWLVEGNDPRGIDVALLSRYPVRGYVSHKSDRFKGVDGDTRTYGFSRDCPEATIELGKGRVLKLLINHLRATDQANLQESLDRRHAQAQRVHEIATESLSSSPQANLAVIGDLNDTPGTKTLTLIQGTSPALYDVVSSTPQDQRYTYIYKGAKEQIDYILAAPGLKSDLTSGQAQALHDSLYYDASDHYPVRASFTLR